MATRATGCSLPFTFALFGNFGVVIELAGAAAFSVGSQAHLYSIVRGCVVHFLLCSFLVEDHCCALDFYFIIVSVRTVTTYKKKAIDLRNLERTFSKRMVRSRGGGSWTHNNDRKFGIRSGGEEGDKLMGRFVGNSLKDPLEMGGESFQGHVA